MVNSFFSCKAQIYPLNTDYETIPNYSYLKDLDHELDPYLGIYKANYNGKEITLFIAKQENRLEKLTKKEFYQDALVITYIVKNSSGAVLQDTQNNNLNIELYSTNVRSYDNSVILYYSGTNCGVGWGNIYLKKLNPTQISWTYYPEETIILPGKCPGNPDLTVYLPVAENVVFIKQ